MAIPEEYIFEEIIHKADNIVIHRAKHPIHGKVCIYMPDDTLPSETVVTVKRRLFQNGIRMRSISQLQLPFVTRTLEVSQNPNEPYIIIEYTRYNLQGLINDGIRLKPKRIFQVFSQILEAVTSLGTEGWQTGHLHPSQIQLRDIHQGNVTFTPLEDSGSETNIQNAKTDSVEETLTHTVSLKETAGKVPAQRGDGAAAEDVGTSKGGRAAKLSGAEESKDRKAELPERDLRSIQRNIYILGDIAYRMLFGSKYRLSDNTAVVNIHKLSSRWRKVVNRALSPSLEDRYESFEAMLHDINKALSRNKRIAIGVTPIFVLLLGVGVLFGYNQYTRHKIMTSEAGQAIENFLRIVNKTNSELGPPLERPASPAEPNDGIILKPFDGLTTLSEED
jgi:serine/threonine protein kinase